MTIRELATVAQVPDSVIRAIFYGTGNRQVDWTGPASYADLATVCLFLSFQEIRIPPDIVFMLLNRILPDLEVAAAKFENCGPEDKLPAMAVVVVDGRYCTWTQLTDRDCFIFDLRELMDLPSLPSGYLPVTTVTLDLVAMMVNCEKGIKDDDPDLDPNEEGAGE